MSKKRSLPKTVTISDLLHEKALLQQFVRDLKNGEIAVIPTDTLYGFAIDGDSCKGARSLFEVKGRDENKPLIAFIDSIQKLKPLGIFPQKDVEDLLEKHWPGGLTAIFPFSPGPLKAFTNHTLGVRIPNHVDLQMLLTAYPGFFLTSSANRSGFSPLSSPEEIKKEFGNEVSWILDGGIISLSEPSTVVDMTVWPPKILRQGKIRI
jgi:L-threonylcarbamoyladenylate synthase